MPVITVRLWAGRTRAQKAELARRMTDAHLRTSRPGLFACGDARAGLIKQIANAVGEGALAAIEVEKYLVALDFAATQANAGAVG